MNSRRRFSDRAWTAFSVGAVVAAILPLASIIFFVTTKGLPTISWAFLTSPPPLPGFPGGGIANAIQGSLVMVVLASAIGIPVGILSGVYVSEFGTASRYAQSVRFLSDVLAGIPSIVTGIFVYALFVLTTGSFSALAGSIALGIMVMPIVSTTTSEALKLVPNSLREASVALGVRKWRTTSLVLANAVGGVTTGVLLSVARITGETAPLILTALGSQGFFTDVFHPVNALTLTIFGDATSGDPTLVAQAYGASFVLLMAVLAISIAVRVATRRKFTYA